MERWSRRSGRWERLGRCKKLDEAMLDGNSEMVSMVSCREGELEEDQGGRGDDGQ